MGTRDERLEDLFFVDVTSEGNPTEEGQVRYVSTDIRAYINGAVRSILQDELAKVSANDTTSDYLAQKIVAGSGITINELNDGSNETLEIVGAAGSDERVKITANDTTADYLFSKLVAGTGITLTEQNDGANETLLIEGSDRAWRRHFLLMGG